MRKKIIISTSNFYSEKDYLISKAIDEILKLNVDGIELMFATEQELSSFDLTKEKSKLSSFPLIGIHAPTDVQYGNSKEGNKTISSLKQIYDKLNANYIVFHNHAIKDFSIFNEKNPKYKLYIENDRKKWNSGYNKLKEIKKTFPNIEIVLDIAHTMEYSLNDAKKISKLFDNDVKIIHLSTAYGNKRHQPLYSTDKEILKKLDFIKKLDCPIVIELWRPSLDVLKKEIEFIKKIINK